MTKDTLLNVRKNSSVLNEFAYAKTEDMLWHNVNLSFVGANLYSSQQMYNRARFTLFVNLKWMHFKETVVQLEEETLVVCVQSVCGGCCHVKLHTDPMKTVFYIQRYVIYLDILLRNIYNSLY
jgi:hypothetical protein